MIAAILAGVLALTSAANAPSATNTNAAPAAPIVNHQSDENTMTDTNLQLIRTTQVHRPSGLDVHIRPIDPAGDLQAKLLELSG